MPTRKLWDDIIETKERFVLRKRKIYPLSRKEREEMYEFIVKQLRKGYIRLLKSPQTTPVFFVGKKNSKKTMGQDYRYLNEWTVKNNYPLPLILNIVENIDTKKIFTKTNLRWNYNNVKEDDKWKMVFITPEGVFKPMIMFFELTNSMAIQTIMNKIL